MRLTIIDQEHNLMQVGVDGWFYSDLDGSQLADNIHAVQWYETRGEIEYKDPETGKTTHNAEIVSVDEFQFAIDAWQVAKEAEEAAEAAAEAAAAAAAAAAEAEASETNGV